jgi:hypothetical protein
MEEANAYALADSPQWEDRLIAGCALATRDVPQARLVLRRLLDDPNIAVIEGTADALIRRGDAYGFELVLGSLAVADDQVANTLLWVIWPAEHLHGLPVARIAEEMASHQDKDVRAGARIALDWHRPPPEVQEQGLADG